jgi:hypothetical protein
VALPGLQVEKLGYDVGGNLVRFQNFSGLVIANQYVTYFIPILVCTQLASPRFAGLSLAAVAFWCQIAKLWSLRCDGVGWVGILPGCRREVPHCHHMAALRAVLRSECRTGIALLGCVRSSKSRGGA